MFDGSSIRGFQAIHESDMKLIPDVTTAFVDSFRAEKTVALNFSIVDPFTDEPYSRDPRNIAAKAEANGDREVLEILGDRLTYAQLHGRTDAMAAAVTALGALYTPAVAVAGAVADDLAIFQRQDRDRHARLCRGVGPEAEVVGPIRGRRAGFVQRPVPESTVGPGPAVVVADQDGGDSSSV